MEFGVLWPTTALVMWAYGTGWWLVAVVLRDNSIVDLAWGPGILLVVVTACLLGTSGGALAWLVLGAVALWATRLAVAIGERNLGHGEDPRYARWRQQWGRLVALRSYLQVFLLQGLLMVLIAVTPAAAVLAPDPSIGVVTWLGLGIFVVGLLIETIGDAQLRRFKADPAHRGQLLTWGLWRYTRHPNYFGEAMLWWGIGLMTAPAIGWLALIAPAVVTILVRFVSGVPIAERASQRRPGWADYAARTNTFIPWVPRNLVSRTT